MALYEVEGIHLMSPMAPSMNGQTSFADHSPLLIIQEANEDLSWLPSFLLIHGDQDKVRRIFDTGNE